MLSEVEEHLGQTVSIVDSDFQVPVDEFDGKVVYGNRRTQGLKQNIVFYKNFSGAQFCGHAPQMATSVAHLVDIERSLQLSYLTGVRDKFATFPVL